MDKESIPSVPPTVSRTAKSRNKSILDQFSGKIGKVEITEKNSEKQSKNSYSGPTASASHGFLCETCNASFTSSDAFLDHCNGKVHQRNLGLNVKIERVDEVDRIKFRLQELTRKRHTAAQIIESQSNVHFEQKLDAAEIESEKLKLDRKLRKKQKKSQVSKNSTEEDTMEQGNDDILAVMGFKSFN